MPCGGLRRSCGRLTGVGLQTKIAGSIQGAKENNQFGKYLGPSFAAGFHSAHFNGVGATKCPLFGVPSLDCFKFGHKLPDFLQCFSFGVHAVSLANS
jgi:hypothetical protein